ncbi:sensor histidine kinase [Brachybacterium aquaticum]|uniref:histidine kinase n=1 Tax=Brachybacterium aquaticum TaxID=1432564 RepID=A0A841AI41_9MICO|nr:HAMP domain-containing sensor histidine kinase [Brachybacterium aquaticum]MBB5832708.1 signal transduction histidine kinase [Brachybacterium aquaticum]
MARASSRDRTRGTVAPRSIAASRTTETPAPGAAPAAAAPRGLGRLTRNWTVRTRVLTTLLALIAIGLAITGALTFAAQFRALDQRVDAELWQEYSELELIAQSTGDDGNPTHTTVDSVLLRATDSAAPSDHESVIAMIDEEPRYQPRQQDFALLPQATEDMTVSEAATVREESERVRQQLLAAHAPNSTVIVPMEVHGRDLRVLIASVTVAGDPAQGLFVVANDIGAQRTELWRSVAVFTMLAVLALLLAGGVGYIVTGRLLRPLEDLRAATEQITVADLEYRVPVPAGGDEISALATNFNRMLGRIQEGFAEQRRFMSDVGHELRTPLTIVRGTLETTDVDDPADVAESHGIAMDELDRMGRVVGDLSELAASSRPDYVKPRPIDLDAFTRSAFARIEHIAERTWILEHSVDVVADADEQRLTQAVVQLAANAARYSDEGTRVWFAVDRVLGPDGPEIHVSVRDEGIGIALEDQRRIFERFARIDASRGSGSGLGLPIVRAIAEGHGGVVRLFSEPGHGSTFTVVFPQHRPHAPAVGESAAPHTGGREAPLTDDETDRPTRTDRPARKEQG